MDHRDEVRRNGSIGAHIALGLSPSLLIDMTCGSLMPVTFELYREGADAGRWRETRPVNNVARPFHPGDMRLMRIKNTLKYAYVILDVSVESCFVFTFNENISRETLSTLCVKLQCKHY